MPDESRGKHSIPAELSLRVLHRGYIVLIGFIGGVIGAVNEFFDGAIKLAPWMSVSIFGVSLVIAVVWGACDLIADRDRKLFDQLSDARGPADPRYDPLSDLLGDSLQVALELSEDGDWPLRDAWERHTRQLVTSAYGAGEAAHIFTPDMTRQRIFKGDEIMNMPRPLAMQINRVRELLGRMPTLTIRSGFSSDSWSAFDPGSYRASNARWIGREGDQKPWNCPWCGRENAWLKDECSACGAESFGNWVYQLDPKKLARPSQSSANT
jgi:hypothetical protein